MKRDVIISKDACDNCRFEETCEERRRRKKNTPCEIFEEREENYGEIHDRTMLRRLSSDRS